MQWFYNYACWNHEGWFQDFTFMFLHLVRIKNEKLGKWNEKIMTIITNKQVKLFNLDLSSKYRSQLPCQRCSDIPYYYLIMTFKILIVPSSISHFGISNDFKKNEKLHYLWRRFFVPQKIKLHGFPNRPHEDVCIKEYMFCMMLAIELKAFTLVVIYCPNLICSFMMKTNFMIVDKKIWMIHNHKGKPPPWKSPWHSIVH